MRADERRDFQVVARKTAESDIDPRIFSFYEPDSPVSEQYRILRTNLLALSEKRRLGTVAVTSSTHGEGKTITAINLAVSLANDQDGKRVLLADGDLRRANVHKYLGMENPGGISDIVCGRAGLDDSLRDTGIPGLTVLPAGNRVRNPAELLCSRAFGELAASLKSRFDMVIFDSPPVIPVTDGSIIAAKCDGALMVVQAGRTQRGVVRHSAGLLRQARARLLGYVLTNIRYHIPAYIYRYL